MNRRNFIKYFTGGLIGAGLVPMVGKSEPTSGTFVVPEGWDISWFPNGRYATNSKCLIHKSEPIADDELRRDILDAVCKKMADELENEIINGGKYIFIDDWS